MKRKRIIFLFSSSWHESYINQLSYLFIWFSAFFCLFVSLTYQRNLNEDKWVKRFINGGQSPFFFVRTYTSDTAMWLWIMQWYIYNATHALINSLYYLFPDIIKDFFFSVMNFLLRVCMCVNTCMKNNTKNH